jgi:hypothetical protein
VSSTEAVISAVTTTLLRNSSGRFNWVSAAR